jgi:hypothetical protein
MLGRLNISETFKGIGIVSSKNCFLKEFSLNVAVLYVNRSFSLSDLINCTRRYVLCEQRQTQSSSFMILNTLT